MAQGTAERALGATDVLAIGVDLTGATSRLDSIVELHLGHLHDQGFSVFVIWIS